MARLCLILILLFFVVDLENLSAQCANAFTKNTQNGATKELVTKEQSWSLKNNFDCKIRFENNKKGLEIRIAIVEERPRFTMAVSDQVSFFSAKGEQKVYNFRENAQQTTSGTNKTYSNALKVDIEELKWLRDNDIVQVNFVNMIEVQSFKYNLSTANQTLFKQIVRCFLEELEAREAPPSAFVPKRAEIPEPTNIKNNCNKYIKDNKAPTTYPLILAAKPNFSCKIYFENAKEGLIGVITTTEPFSAIIMNKGDKLVFTATNGVQKSSDFLYKSEQTKQDRTTDHITYVNTIELDAAMITWLSENDIEKLGFAYMATRKMPTYVVETNRRGEFKQLASCFLDGVNAVNPSLITNKSKTNTTDNKTFQSFETVTNAEATNNNSTTVINNSKPSQGSWDISDLSLSTEEAAKKYRSRLEKELEGITDSNLKNVLLNAKIGTIFFEQQQYLVARPYFQKALKIIETSNVGQEEKAGIETRLAHILLNKKQYNTAIVYNTNALQNWSKSAVAQDQNLLFNTYLNQGKILKNIDSLDQSQALSSYKQAQAIIPTLDKNIQTDKKIEVLMAIGALYFDNKTYNLAKNSYTEVLTLMKNNDFKNHPKEIEATRMLGEIALAQGSYKDALMYLEQTQTTLLGNNEPLSESTIKKMSSNPAALELVQVITAKGILKSQQNASEEELKKALKEYGLATKLLLELRKTHRNESTDKQLDKVTDKMSQQAVVICHKLHQLTQNEEYLKQVFDYAELSKSGAVYEVSQDLKVAAGIPQDEINKENSLKLQQAYFRSQLLEELKKGNQKNEARLKELEDKIAIVTSQYQTLIQQFEQKYPKYHALKYQQKNTSLEDLQAVLNPNEVFLEYIATDSFIYVLAIAKNELKSQLNKLPKPLSQIIRKLQYGLRKNEAHFYEEHGLTIYNNAIGALSTFIKGKNLIIAPDAELYYIPFGVLPTSRVGMQDGQGYGTVPFFIQQHPICYNHSATAYLASKNTSNNANQSIATWAPHFDGLDAALRSAGIGEKLDALPGAEKEANAIAALFGYNAFIGKDATETNFKKQATNFYILHLATHGLLNDDEPLFSSLAMTNDTENDGLLYADELYNMQLNANLAVLSACNSGMGKLSKAEGVVGVASGFAYAGVPNIVMSKWPVSDAATMVLMQTFYKNIQAGMPKDVALQQAKIQYLTQFKDKDKLLAPFFWGGFVLSGNPDPISIQTAGTNYWLYAGLCLLLGGGLFLGLKYRKPKQIA